MITKLQLINIIIIIVIIIIKEMPVSVASGTPCTTHVIQVINTKKYALCDRFKGFSKVILTVRDLGLRVVLGT